MPETLPTTFKIPRQPEFPDVTFLRLQTGRIPKQFEVTITPYDVLRWRRLHDDDSPWYTGTSPFGGPVAMPWILYFASMNVLGHEYGRDRPLLGNRPPSGFSRYNAEFLAPIPVGSTVLINGEVVDKFQKNGKGFVDWRIEAWVNRQLVQRHWKRWAFPTDPEDLVGVPERASEPKPWEAPAYEKFGPLSLEMTLDRLIDFEGPIPVNTHNDPAKAAAVGLAGPLAQGELSFGLICRLMRDRFGPGFFAGGTIDVRFVRPVYAGQTIRAFGELLGDNYGVWQCRVWAENEAGEVVTTGTATSV